MNIMRLRVWIAKQIMKLIKPELAPMIAILHQRQDQIIERLDDKLDATSVRVTPSGFVKIKK